MNTVDIALYIHNTWYKVEGKLRENTKDMYGIPLDIIGSAYIVYNMSIDSMIKYRFNIDNLDTRDLIKAMTCSLDYTDIKDVKY